MSCHGTASTHKAAINADCLGMESRSRTASAARDTAPRDACNAMIQSKLGTHATIHAYPHAGHVTTAGLAPAPRSQAPMSTMLWNTELSGRLNSIYAQALTAPMAANNATW